MTPTDKDMSPSPESMAKEIADLSIRSLVATPETNFKKLRFSLVERKVLEAITFFTDQAKLEQMNKDAEIADDIGQSAIISDLFIGDKIRSQSLRKEE